MKLQSDEKENRRIFELAINPATLIFCPPAEKNLIQSSISPSEEERVTNKLGHKLFPVDSNPHKNNKG